MKDLPRYDGNFKDIRLDQFVRDLLKSLTGVLDLNVYVLPGQTWKPGMLLSVPINGVIKRSVSPRVVKLVRAVADSGVSPVHFGATSWTWQGDNQVKIDDIAGLVSGAKYDLTFEVIS